MRPTALLIASGLFLLSALNCAAETGAELVRFFRPVAAQIVMPIEDGILIDKGGADRINPGDIFVVVNSETQLRHPQTGQVLDTLRNYGAFYQVTRVKQNLAYCQPLGKPATPQAGTAVRRFENLPLHFVDSAGDGFALFTSLREQLPHLQWQDYLTESGPVWPEDRPALLIRHAKDQLQVVTRAGRILFAQQRPVTAPGRPPAAAAGQPAVVPLPAPAAATAVAPVGGAGTGEKYLRIRLPSHSEVQALEVHDLDRDGSPEILLGLDGSVLIGRLGEADEFIELSRFEARHSRTIVALSAIDLDLDGQVELVVSALEENEVVSEILSYADKKLTSVASSRLLLAAYQPVDGQEILLGMSKTSLLSSRPQLFRISLRGSRIEKTAFSLPAARQPFGIVPLTGTKGNIVQALLTETARLKVVNRQGESLWTSKEHYGGSTAYFSIPQPGSRSIGENEKLFLNAALKRSVTGNLLTAQHSPTGFFKNSPEYKNGRIAELRWNGFALEEVGTSANLGGLISDFEQADVDADGDQDLIAAVVYTQKGFFTKPVSGIVVILNER